VLYALALGGDVIFIGGEFTGVSAAPQAGVAAIKLRAPSIIFVPLLRRS